jgi:fatty acid desaturase
MDPAQVAAMQAAARAALEAAARNAAKTGMQSSEFKITMAGIATAAALAGIDVLAHLPGPWMLPAMALSTAITVCGYALARSRVKSAALQAAADVALASSPAVPPPPPIS